MPPPVTDPDPRQFTLRWLLTAIAVLALPLAFVHYALGMPELFPAAAMAVMFGLAVFIAILLAIVLPIALLVLPDSSRLRISRWVAILWLAFVAVVLVAISAQFALEAWGQR